MPEPESRPRVQSAARAMAILLAVAERENGLTARELSELLGLSRQTVYHLLHTLIESGVLLRDDERILLGLGAGTIAHGFEQQLSPAERLAPIVREVAHRTDETAYAAGWRHGEILVHAVHQGTNPVQIAEVPRGFTGLAHARASGKLLLAVSPVAVRDEYLATHPLERVTSKTIVDRTAFAAELAWIRQAGYAVDNEEFAEGVCCVAFPLDRGPAPFVVAISAPRERFEESFEDYLAALRAIARPPSLTV